MTVQHATDTDFAAKTSTGKPVLIDFHATWCGPCRQVAPIVDAIANEHPEYTVVKVDVDQAPGIAQQFGIMGVPTLVVLNSDGTPASQDTGVKPKAAILASLNKAS
jgi:thioredoxin 1